MGNSLLAAVLVLWVAVAAAGQATPEELMSKGRFDDALEAYRQSIARSPKLVAAYLGAGSAADLAGRYEEAHRFFQLAIRMASVPAENAPAQRAMAVSYAFVNDCRNAERYSRRAFDYFLSLGDRSNAGETANEIGRICLEAGDFNRAGDWYDRGRSTALEEEDLKPARIDLWNFRWSNARARIAARQGKYDETKRQVARAKSILDKGRIPEQEPYFAYLAGYTAFYEGDLQGALKNFRAALQNDVFVLNLEAQCFEKLGDEGNAIRYYQLAASVTSHTLSAAFAQPFALRKLQARHLCTAGNLLCRDVNGR